jgi:hypothetical protein
MDIFKELHETMDAFAETIAKEVAEKRFYEVAEVKAIAKTRLWSAIYECLHLQVSDAEIKRRGLIEQYGTAKENRIEIGVKLAKLNSVKADANRLIHNMRDYNHFEQLKKYLKNTYGHQAWKDFRDNHLNTDEYRIRKYKSENAENINVQPTNDMQCGDGENIT